MDDKTILWDCLKDQKFLSGNYSQMSTEVACPDLLNDVMKICEQEIRANFDIFTLMNQKGWYPLEYAQLQELNKVKTMASQISSSL